ncbi:uncharacterized protein BJX67DRAFT_169229 [Aspergillus lucknowensis]|uniref:Uncharacterized protein n=1 Tax=Aspergillus lucknowensis TaxID=176173 RepID=A0ABR4LMI3_9EURO
MRESERTILQTAHSSTRRPRTRPLTLNTSNEGKKKKGVSEVDAGGDLSTEAGRSPLHHGKTCPLLHCGHSQSMIDSTSENISLATLWSASIVSWWRGHLAAWRRIAHAAKFSRRLHLEVVCRFNVEFLWTSSQLLAESELIKQLLEHGHN